MIRPLKRAAAVLMLWLILLTPAGAAEPLKIGFSMALTGGLAANGKAALLAYQIWVHDQNAKGGLLGRPVELVYYDDQSNPSTVPGIYTKLIEVDKVDLVISSYGTNLISPAMPLMMKRGRVLMGLFGFGVNEQFNYPNYFSMVPWGPSPQASMQGFIDLALSQQPKPTTVAIIGADAEFSKRAADALRDDALKAGLKIVYDRAYPPTTSDFTAILHGVQAANPDLVFAASYPPDTAGLIRAAHEIGLKARLFGGAMVGTQFAALKSQLGPLLNRIVSFEFYVPEPTVRFPGIEDFLTQYQSQADQAGVDTLGFYLPPFAYAELQVLAQAVQTTGSLAQDKLGAALRAGSFDTIVGSIRFAPNGEWATARVLTVQFQGIRNGDIAQFRHAGTQVILAPSDRKSGDFIYPYSDAER